MKNNKCMKIASLLLGGIVIISGLLPGLSQRGWVVATGPDEVDLQDAEAEIKKTYPALMGSNDANHDKIETTYVIMDPDGTLNKVIVSEQLTNNSREKELEDVSSLTDIENTSGDEGFSREGNQITWQADGNQIRYKGKGTKELPVTVHISYYLDDEEKTAQEIAGRAGKVRIRFDYEVTQEDSVQGKTYTHPYTMASGLILDNAHFSDISVTKGKTVDNGNQTMVFGIAFPGMNENLHIDRSQIDIPSSVEITAYTDKFEIMGTYTLALSSPLKDIDTGRVDEISDKVQALQDGLHLLATSSNRLLEGADDLSNGMLALNQGIAGLGEGVDRLQEGSTRLLSGATELNRGLETLSTNSEAINEGLAQWEASVFENASTQMRQATGKDTLTLTPGNYVALIQDISDSALLGAEQKLRGILAGQGVTDPNLQDQILSVAYNALLLDRKTEATKEEIADHIQAAAMLGQKAAFVKSAIEKNTSMARKLLKEQGYTEEQITEEMLAVTAIAWELSDGHVERLAENLPEARDQLRGAAVFQAGQINASENVERLAAIAVGKETPEKLAELKGNLDRVEEVLVGVRQYTNGLDRAAAESEKLLAGMEDLNRGVSDLRDASQKLSGGSKTLKEGMDMLDQGLNRFNQAGIDQFVHALDEEKVSETVTALEGVREASEKEIFLGGKREDMTGEARIIFKTGAVK